MYEPDVMFTAVDRPGTGFMCLPFLLMYEPDVMFTAADRPGTGFMCLLFLLMYEPDVMFTAADRLGKRFLVGNEIETGSNSVFISETDMDYEP